MRCRPTAQTAFMDEAVRRYVDGIALDSRAMFDRMHRLIMDAHPEATDATSYQISDHVHAGESAVTMPRVCRGSRLACQ